MTLTTSDWAEYPKPSPTSRLGINVRYYVFTPDGEVLDGEGPVVAWDMGVLYESRVEDLYDEVVKYEGISLQAFETSVRENTTVRMGRIIEFNMNHQLYVMGTRDVESTSRIVAAMNAETAHMTDYLVLWNLRKARAIEKQRLVSAEQRTVDNLLSQVFDSDDPFKDL